MPSVDALLKLGIVVLPVVFLPTCRFASANAGEDVMSDKQINQRIIKHRTAEVSLRLSDANGRPLSGAPVTIRQVKHKFLFGCNAFGLGRDPREQKWRAYREQFAELFNFATLPFFWGAFEREEGKLEMKNLRRMTRWCVLHDIEAEGTPLCWHQVWPGWLKEMDLAQVRRLQIARIEREVKSFAREVGTWVVVNEPVIMPNWKEKDNPITKLSRQLGCVDLIREAYTAARKGNPKATLVLNDYDLSPRYEKLIEECMGAGVQFDVIGLQSHMHSGYWGPNKTWETIERFARFNKPLYFTEVTILSGKIRRGIDCMRRYDDWATTREGEKLQEKQVVEFYRLLFSRPAVKRITWWDLQDGAWLGAPSGLLRKDMTPKPVYNALKKLIKEDWWTGPLQLRTDAAGKVSFRGFLGDYLFEFGRQTMPFSVEDIVGKEISICPAD
jgi:endo-1,4-beta-xylanase